MDRARRAEADDVREADLRAFDLAGTGLAAEVEDHFCDVRDAGRAERVALRKKPARGVDHSVSRLRVGLDDEGSYVLFELRRDIVAEPRGAAGNVLDGFAIAAEAEVLVVEELGGREAVVELDLDEVLRADAC